MGVSKEQGPSQTYPSVGTYLCQVSPNCLLKMRPQQWPPIAGNARKEINNIPRPREATSVAIRIGERPLLNSLRTQSRSRLKYNVRYSLRMMQIYLLTVPCLRESRERASHLDEDTS